MMDLNMVYVRTYYMYLQSERKSYEDFQKKAEELGIDYIALPVNLEHELRDPTVTVLIPANTLSEDIEPMGHNSYRIGNIPELYELRTMEVYKSI